jgi:hypothetical protein
MGKKNDPYYTGVFIDGEYVGRIVAYQNHDVINLVISTRFGRLNPTPDNCTYRRCLDVAGYRSFAGKAKKYVPPKPKEIQL